MHKLKQAAYLIGMALMVVYLLNPGAGVFELIPDNIPVIGNLDEAAAALLLVRWWHAWRALRRSLPTAAPPQTGGAT